MARLKRFLFAVLSRSGVAIYSRLPIFGHLRASVAILREGERFLVIDRSDGRGFSFPGGLAFPWEDAEQAMRREVLEETGLKISQCRLLFEHKTSNEVRCILSVFEAEASGNLTESWEGTPRWLTAKEMKDKLLPSQQQIIARIP
jgi:8-oxo-dGTP diphosphatase